LKDWQQKNEDQPAAVGGAGTTPAAPDDHRLPVHSLPQNHTEPGGAPLDHAPEKKN
jgi:hypothetical protein